MEEDMSDTAKTVTNEEILKNVQDLAQSLQDFIQMTSEGLDRLDRNMEGTNQRLDGVEGEIRLLKGEVRDLKQASYRHELQLAEFTHTQERLNDLIHIDIKEILDRLAAIEDRLPTITEADVRKLQTEMQTVVDWIAKVSKLRHIPIKFPS